MLCQLLSCPWFCDILVHFNYFGKYMWTIVTAMEISNVWALKYGKERAENCLCKTNMQSGEGGVTLDISDS